VEAVSHPERRHDGVPGGADPEQFELWVEEDDAD
jgi:hypothetical protein